jgi:hypothetical protein
VIRRRRLTLSLTVPKYIYIYDDDDDDDDDDDNTKMTTQGMSGKLIMGTLLVVAAGAVLTSSVYPLLIARPPADARAADFPKTPSRSGLKRPGMWASVSREAVNTRHDR